MADDQDRAEALDDDKLTRDYPPEEPWGVDEAEVTPEGEWAQESFEERTERHTNDGVDDDRPVVVPYSEANEDLVDDEAQLVADAEEGDHNPESETAPAAAEEAAVHITDQP
jgi:hypothetical protein